VTRACTTAPHSHNQRTFSRRQIAQLAVGETERLYRTSAGTAAVRQIRPPPRAALTSQQNQPETVAVLSGDNRSATFRLQSVTTAALLRECVCFGIPLTPNHNKIKLSDSINMFF